MTDKSATPTAPVALTTAVSDRYRIGRELGRGGMATVYLARDLKHDRDVAMKVLDPELGAVLGAERFLSEIRVTANLQHPNLLPLFDSGQVRGHPERSEGSAFLYYVMPYIEGESLRARLTREKQLPIDEALRIATAVANALDYAHRRGVIHRDLKPENILLHEGQPLVADFGIALAVSNAGGARVTQTGLSLGTPQYMSPEQATGDRQIDARADVYALGAVTYEMLAGEAPHTGSSAQAIIARVLTERPRSVRAARPNVPPHVEAALECALEKLAADRFASAREFAGALTGAQPVPVAPRSAATPAAAPPTVRSRLLRATPWVLAAAATAAALRPLVQPEPTRPVLATFTIPVADSLKIGTGSGSRIAISPDGTLLVYALQAPSRHQMLYARRLDDTVARPIPGTEDAGGPSFTPDGRSILFIARGARGGRRPGFIVPVGGGTPRQVAPGAIIGLSAGDDGRILYVERDLYLGTSDGSAPRILMKVDSTQHVTRISWPDFLPGGEYAVVTYWRGGRALDSARLAVVSTKDGRWTDLGTTGLNPHYAEPGYLVFGRFPNDLFAAAFSLTTRRITGAPVRLTSSVIVGTAGGVSAGVARNGTLVFMPVSDLARSASMFAVDRGGKEHPISRTDTGYSEARLSPDGRHIAVTIGPISGGAIGPIGGAARGSTVWVYDMATGGRTRLSPDSGASRPEWSADGSQVFFRQQYPDSAHLLARPWDLSGPPRLIARGEPLAFQELSFGPAHGLAAMRSGISPTTISLASSDSLNAARPLFDRLSDMLGPRVSPSGKLLAFSSNETGRAEVYITPIPGPGPRVLVSVDGGEGPMWSRDGKTLFFRPPFGDGPLMAATIVEQPSLAVTRRDTLFSDIYQYTGAHADYDVFPDGRLLMMRGINSANVAPVTPVVVINWQRLLENTGSSPK